MTSILAESLGILWSGGRGKQKNKNKEQNGGDKWEIVYWGGGAFRGRAELVKLVFAAADVKYTMQGDGIPEIIAAYPKEPTPVATILAKTPKHFAPPILRNTATGFELSQTPAILEYLGEKFGLVPHSLEDKARARQVALSACDFLADGRAPFHPVKPTESYAIQKDKQRWLSRSSRRKEGAWTAGLHTSPRSSTINPATSVSYTHLTLPTKRIV